MEVTELEMEVEGAINRASRENDSNTPDWILAGFMMRCLDAFELASNKREVWYGVHLDILNKWDELILTAIGEASMCWSETPKGVFKSEKALAIGKQLLADIKAEPKKETTV